MPHTPRRDKTPSTTGSETSEKGFDLEVMKEVMRTALSDALTPVTARLDALEKQAHGKKDATPKAPKGTTPNPPDISDKAVEKEMQRIGVSKETVEIDSSSSGTDTRTESSSEDTTPPPRKKKSNKRKKAKKAKKDEKEKDKKEEKAKKGGKSKGKELIIGKSGRYMTAENCAESTVPWPHHAVFSGPRMQGALYDDLTVADFVYGFMTRAELEDYVHEKDAMWDYLRDLMRDTKNRPGAWVHIRNYHAIFLTMLERRQITWTSKADISELKTLYVYTVMTPAITERPAVPSIISNQNQGPPDKHYVPCLAYQHGTCNREDGHNGLNHICNYCWREKGRANKHGEQACYTLVGVPARKRTGQF